MSKYFILILWAIALVLSLFGSDINAIQASATAAIAIGAGASLLGGLVSDYINTKSQADTNEANKEIARENREWQSNENQIAREWSERQWELNNQYNTPSAIAERQRQAGFNPFLLGSKLGEGQSQPAQANTTSMAPDTPSMVAPRVGATAQGLHSASNMIGQYALYKQGVDAQAANQQSQSDMTAVNVAKELNKFDPSYRNKFGETRGDEYLSNYFGSQVRTRSENSYDLRSAKANLRRSEADAELSEINAALQRQFGSKRANAALVKIDQEITESAARIGKMASDAKLNDAQIKTEAQKFWTEVAKQYNLKKQGEYYVATAEQISLLKDLTANRMRLENEILNRRNVDDFSSFRSRALVRDWMESDEGQNTTLQNYEIGTDIFLNQADKVIKTISPIAPSYNINSGSYKYDRNININP